LIGHHETHPFLAITSARLPVTGMLVPSFAEPLSCARARAVPAKVLEILSW
jgi:hypothetical protein